MSGTFPDKFHKKTFGFKNDKFSHNLLLTFYQNDRILPDKISSNFLENHNDKNQQKDPKNLENYLQYNLDCNPTKNT